jgi:hypothetical protein
VGLMKLSEVEKGGLLVEQYICQENSYDSRSESEYL